MEHLCLEHLFQSVEIILDKTVLQMKMDSSFTQNWCVLFYFVLIVYLLVFALVQVPGQYFIKPFLREFEFVPSSLV